MLLLLISLFLLAGCAVAKPAVPAMGAVVAEPRDRFAAAGSVENVRIADAWWTRFDDPLLTTYVERAGLYSPSILQAVARTEQARAQARIARADLYPQISARFGASRQRQNLSGLGFGELLPTPPGGGGSDGGEADDVAGFVTNSLSASANVSWELDLWGRIGTQNDAARADFLASLEKSPGRAPVDRGAGGSFLFRADRSAPKGRGVGGAGRRARRNRAAGRQPRRHRHRAAGGQGARLC
ncbi:TolC family protein [Erythrobacter sp. NFXS35]